MWQQQQERRKESGKSGNEGWLCDRRMSDVNVRRNTGIFSSQIVVA